MRPDRVWKSSKQNHTWTTTTQNRNPALNRKAEFLKRTSLCNVGLTPRLEIDVVEWSKVERESPFQFLIAILTSILAMAHYDAWHTLSPEVVWLQILICPRITAWYCGGTGGSATHRIKKIGRYPSTHPTPQLDATMYHSPRRWKRITTTELSIRWTPVIFSSSLLVQVLLRGRIWGKRKKSALSSAFQRINIRLVFVRSTFQYFGLRNGTMGALEYVTLETIPKNTQICQWYGSGWWSAREIKRCDVGTIKYPAPKRHGKRPNSLNRWGRCLSFFTWWDYCETSKQNKLSKQNTLIAIVRLDFSLGRQNLFFGFQP